MNCIQQNVVISKNTMGTNKSGPQKIYHTKHQKNTTMFKDSQRSEIVEKSTAHHLGPWQNTLKFCRKILPREEAILLSCSRVIY